MLPTLTWDAPRPIDADKVGAVRAALVADQGKTPIATDPYFFGKQVSMALAAADSLFLIVQNFWVNSWSNLKEVGCSRLQTSC